jgi:Fe-S cluster assembly protein SufD
VAIGRLDEDMIFYLRARGIAEAEARSMLAYAFAAEVLGTVAIPELRTELEGSIARWLAHGEPRRTGGRAGGEVR